MSVPLLVNGVPQGELNTMMDEGDTSHFAVSGRGLLAVLKIVLKPDVYAQYEPKLKTADWLKPDELEAMKLVFKFKQDTFTITLTLPGDLLPEQTIDFGPSLARPQTQQTVFKPAGFSGFSNLRVNKSFDDTSILSSSPDQALRLFTENVQNINGYYLESNFNYEEYSNYPWTRGDIRLSKDFEASATRLTAGDFDLPFVGFQASVPLGGLLYRKDFNIQPGLSVSPVSRFTFFLTTPSRVAVYVNERLLRELTLPAGRHHLNQLPVEPGINNIRLEITDEAGRVSQISFPFIYDIELLDDGLQDFSYSAGRERRIKGGSTQYSEAGDAVSLYHRWGVTPSITAGGNYQGDQGQRMLGGECVFGTSLGLFGLDAAASSTDDFGPGQAAQLRYRSNMSDTIFRGSVQMLSQNFAPLGVTFPNNLYSATASASVTSSLQGLFSFSLGTNYNFSRNSSGDSITNFGTISRSFASRLNGVFQLTQVIDPARGNDLRGYFMLQWTDSSSQVQAMLAEDTGTGDTRGDVTYVPRGGGLGAGGGAVYNGGLREAHAELDLVSRKGEYSVGEQVSKSPLTSQTLIQTRLDGAAAIAYTGSSIGLTRPIYDSFAVIKPQGRLKDQVIEIEPIEGTPQAIADSSGAGFIPNLRAYVTQPLQLQTRDPLAMAMLPQDSIFVRPTYRSGVEVVLIPESSILLSGRIVTTDPKNPTLNLLTGVLEPEGAAGDPRKFYFFTNEEGQFMAESVPPGKYQLRLDGYKGTASINVPDSAFGPFDIGDVKYDFKKETE